MRKRVREMVMAATLVVALLLVAAKLSDATLPFRDSYGCLWEPFLLEEKNSVDMLFMGSSLAYCNVIPSVVYEETGYSAYVLSGPHLTTGQSYYYLKEAYRTQSPKVVFLEITGLFFSRYGGYAQINIGYMPWSVNRVRAAFSEAAPAERWGLLFPPYFYHELWLNYWDDSKRLEVGQPYAADPLAGYTFLRETVAQDTDRERMLTEYDEAAYAIHLQYLEKIATLCQEKGTKLVLYSTPMYKPLEAEYYTKLTTEAAPLAEYHDLNAQLDRMGLDKEDDFYDLFHLNYRGAIKFSKYLTPIIAGQDLGETLSDPQTWKARVDYWAELITKSL